MVTRTPVDWDEFSPKRFSFDAIGDKAAGVITGIRVENGQSGRTPVLEVRDPDGRDRELWCGSVDLRSKVAEARPDVGDSIDVEYIEAVATGMPTKMKRFRVAIERASGGELDEDAF
jgi:hypothetical protein